MKLEEYKEKCFETWGAGNEIIRTKIGIEEEFGELSGKVKRWYRGDYGNDFSKFKQELIGELGDCLYYLTMGYHYFCKPVDWEIVDSDLPEVSEKFLYEIWETLINNKRYYLNHKSYILLIRALIAFSNQCGLTIDEVIEYNIAKLQDRKKRGVIKGCGDAR